MMKFKFCFFFIIMVCSVLLFSCGNTEKTESEKISVICTAFPQYDWVREIVGEKSDIFDITYITRNGVDMHSYQPSAEDIIKISDCDILISIGGISEKWIDDAAENSQNEERIHLKLIDELGENIMMVGSEHTDEHFGTVDEHVWLSLKNAVVFCEKICAVISEKDKENASYYSDNTEKYISDLNYIDKVTEEFVASSPRDTVIMADRFPFGYTLRDYGIKYCSAFDGCSSDSQVTFETVIRLSEAIDDMDIKAVLINEDSDAKIAEAVISNAKNKEIEIYRLDSMQSVSEADIRKGMRYIEVMRDNLALIHGALIV